jgi:glycosyltransferase involved in cell wall biosynthesis
VSHSSGLLGAERSLLEMVREAVAQDHEVVVTLPVDGALREMIGLAGACVKILPTRAWMGPKHSFWPIGALRLTQCWLAAHRHKRFYKTWQPDVVITNTAVVPVGAWAARALSVPHIWLVRESIGENPSLKSLLSSRHILFEIARSSIAVGVVSAYVESLVRKGGSAPTRYFRVTPRPSVGHQVDKSVWSPGSRGLHLLLPGYVSLEKGQLLAIRALAKCGVENATLTIVGHGKQRSIWQLRMLTRMLHLGDRVAILPFAPDMRALYESADAVLMTSAHEAYGRTTIEALGFGLPVIAFDSGGSREILCKGGGALVTERTAVALANSIDAFAVAPAEMHRRMRAEGSATVKALLASDSPFEHLIQEIQRLPSHEYNA